MGPGGTIIWPQVHLIWTVGFVLFLVGSFARGLFCYLVLEMLESGSNRTSRAKSNSEEEVVVRVSLKSQILVSFLRDDHSYNRLVLLCDARWV